MAKTSDERAFLREFYSGGQTYAIEAPAARNKNIFEFLCLESHLHWVHLQFFPYSRFSILLLKLHFFRK